MADGFKKYFNGTTINGRANVAKATYGTIALLYVIYRLRRGSGKSSGELASGKCSCESDHEAPLNGDIGVYGVDPDCSVCRERSERAMTEYDREQQRRAAGHDEEGCRDDPPPPPPPSSGGSGGAGSAPPCNKCPCEENPRPASQLMGQVHDTFYRVLRGVVGAVMGTAAVSTIGSGSGTANGSPPAAQLEEEEGEDEERHEYVNETPLKRRSAPRFCLATTNRNTKRNTNSQCQEQASERQPEEAAREKAEAQPEDQPEYSAFSDGFTSGLYFTSDEK
ncbi:uncharacterized protein LOC128264771 [Drosophila gunungcola]|uniref:Uncharacterized protein n=1 Tax=Drosophila gunungcola TaxID=103775 RepID=A0A9P9YC52_9MUSC|nr:uncharacterized protein LOC128264771 [Drosophila gunungcola]KAI8034195.1 hypothetical protein M5D96_013046 [Drosophila gunungcola]